MIFKFRNENLYAVSLMKIAKLFLVVFVFLGISSAHVLLAQGTDPSVLVQTGQSPPEPYISISPDYFYTLEEILYLEGRANPNALVMVQLRKDAGTEKPVNFKIKADTSGEWVVAEKTYLSAGNWEVRARQQVGALVSAESNPRVIRSVVTGVNLFGLSIRYVVIAGFVFAFILIIIFIFWYFRRKIQVLQRGLMEKQLHETEDRFHRGFAEIRNELMEELKALATNAQGRSLTPEELDKRDRVLRELASLEQGLDHDITDISKRY